MTDKQTRLESEMNTALEQYIILWLHVHEKELPTFYVQRFGQQDKYEQLERFKERNEFYRSQGYEGPLPQYIHLTGQR